MSYTEKLDLFDETTAQLILSRLNDIARMKTGLAPAIENWDTVQRIVRAGTGANAFPVGTQLVVPHDTLGDLVWDVIGHDQDTPVDPAYTHTMTLQTHSCLAARQFNGTQCNYKIIDTIAAGAWCIKLQHPDYESGVDTYYDFTSDVEMGVGGLLRRQGGHVEYYAPANKTLATPTKQYSLTAGEVNTKLTVSPTEGAQLSAQNESTRVKYGSDRWLHSSVRQWLNSSAAVGTWWAQYTDSLGTRNDLYSLAPSTPTYATDAGFLNGMDADFLAVVGNVLKTTMLNAVTDGATTNASAGDLGANDYDVLTERFFLPARKETGFIAQNYVDEGVLYTYYPSGGVPQSIKYRSGAAAGWMLRTPIHTEAYSIVVVTSAGVVTSSSSNSASYAPAPCCVIW